MEFWDGADEASWDEAQRRLFDLGVTDGLPVVPPTRRRVEAMLERCGLDAAGVVTLLPPVMVEATWGDIAVNAVMAGCLPEHLPVVGAAIEAIADPAFNFIGIASTTGSATPALIVDGPIVDALGLNADCNLLGPGNRANACIGRAVNLVLRNVGECRPGEFDMSTLGQPAKYTCCIAENVAASPWPALHVERGFAADESVVTVAGIAGSVEVVDSASSAPEDLAQTFAQSMLIAGSLGGGAGALLGGGEPLLIVPPEIAAAFDRGGWSKSDVKSAIFERAVMPADRLAGAVRDHLVGLRRAEGAADPLAPIRVAARADDLMIVVAGGVGIKSAYLPTWGGTTRAASRAIRSGR